MKLPRTTQSIKREIDPLNANLAICGAVAALAAFVAFSVLAVLGNAYFYKAIGLAIAVPKSALTSCLAAAKWSALTSGIALFIGVSPKLFLAIVHYYHQRQKTRQEKPPIRVIDFTQQTLVSKSSNDL